VRLSATGDLLGDLNPKWVYNRIPIAYNGVSIWKTHFGCQERYNLNLSILSWRPIYRKGSLLSLVVEED
jgi:hypothetical protein